MIALVPNPAWLDGVVYAESLRTHEIDGKPAPSVTQVLKAAGLTDAFAHVTRSVLARKASLGSAAHSATHFHDDGDLDESTVADEICSRLDAWKWFRSCRDFEPILSEQIVCSREYGYLGKLDRFGVCEGMYLVLDLACGPAKAARKDLQTAGYVIALLEQYPELRGHAIERWAVELLPNGRYRLRSYPGTGRTGRMDRSEFLSAVATVHEATALAGGEPLWKT